jgi:hypothetical protein
MSTLGETDLAKMLGTLAVSRRPGVFVFVAVGVPTPGLLAAAHAMVTEGELTTLVVPIDVAERSGLTVTTPMAWLTLTVHSSLEAVGLTASFSAMLGDVDIPCNVLAGYQHDHILVPLRMVDDAIAVLTAHSVR